MNGVRRAIGILGETLITLGVLVLLFVVWQIGWQGMTEGRAQSDQVSALEQSFGPSGTGTQGTAKPPKPGGPSTVQHAPPEGDAFAILRIPRLGQDWAKPVYQGVSLPILHKGIGHYVATQMPGELGNFAVAGHRSGGGNPLINIDQIQNGDKLVVETKDTYFVYTVDRHIITTPTNTTVLEPLPERPGQMPTKRYMVVTTCEPRWGNAERWIVFSTLTAQYPRSQGLPASELKVVG